MMLILTCVLFILSTFFQCRAASLDLPSLEETQKSWTTRLQSAGTDLEISQITSEMTQQMQDHLIQVWTHYLQVQQTAGLLKADESHPNPEELVHKFIKEHEKDKPDNLIKAVCNHWGDLLERIAQINPAPNFEPQIPPISKGILSWQDYEQLIETWEKQTLNASPENCDQVHQDIMHDIKEHLVPLISGLQVFRKKKYLASNPKWVPKDPVTADTVAQSFLEENWQARKSNDFSILRRTFRTLLRKQGLPVPSSHLKLYRRLVKKGACAIKKASSQSYPTVIKNVYDSLTQRLDLLLLGQAELKRQIQELTQTFDLPLPPSTPPLTPDQPRIARRQTAADILDQLDKKALEDCPLSQKAIPSLIAQMFHKKLWPLFKQLYNENEQLVEQRNILARGPILPPPDGHPAL